MVVNIDMPPATLAYLAYEIHLKKRYRSNDKFYFTTARHPRGKLSLKPGSPVTRTNT